MPQNQINQPTTQPTQSYLFWYTFILVCSIHLFKKKIKPHHVFFVFLWVFFFVFVFVFSSNVSIGFVVLSSEKLCFFFIVYFRAFRKLFLSLFFTTLQILESQYLEVKKIVFL